ncbi:FkbM family methyltransferase [Methylobacterium sp. JK268]
MWFESLVDTVDVLSRVVMRVSGWIRPDRIGRTAFGARMHCDIRDFIQRRVYFFGIYEPNLTHYLGQRLRPGESVVDVGANVGYVTLLAAHLVGPEGRVTSVEASPVTYRELVRNLTLNGCTTVTPINAAATGESCLVEIVETSRRNIGANTIRPAGGGGRTAVPGRPLSALLGEAAADVALIKIDVEGSEGPILGDILENLAAFPRLHTLVVEMAPESRDYVARFRAAGFTAAALPNNYRIGATLVRRYLARTGEDAFVVKRPVEAPGDGIVDYVFERNPPAAPLRPEAEARPGAPRLHAVPRSA